MCKTCSMSATRLSACISDPTGVGAPGVPPDAVSNGPGVDNRFQSPGMPRAYFGGVKIRFN